jgi:hypothetical protein
MRFGVMLVIAIFISACQTAPISYLAPVPQGDGDAYSCALRQFNQLGFSIANADREAGFITGEKQTSGLGMALLANQTTFDHITVSIFEDGSAGHTMRVTAGSMNQRVMGLGAGAGSRNPNAPQESAKEAARQILRACADGPIREQSGTSNNASYEVAI